MAMKPWLFLTNHGLVFVHKILYPESTNREIAQTLGLTERFIYLILRDLEKAGYLVKRQVGRRTFYEVNTDLTLRHPPLNNIQVKEFLEFISQKQQ